MQNKVTVLIPCKNEINNIRSCIELVRCVADEILVADSGSTDGTLNLVRSLGGCRIIEREYVNYGDFVNWAIPQATHPWVLIVDADERLEQPLAEEIQETLKVAARDGYTIRRRNFFCGHEIKHSGWNRDDVLRLFRRDLGKAAGPGDHAKVAVATGCVGHLQKKLVHYTYWSIEQYLRKLDRYTTLGARDLDQRGRRTTLAGLLVRAPLRFLQLYILKRGFLDGMPGLIVCMLTAFYSFTKQAKLWALREGLPQPLDDAETQQRTVPDHPASCLRLTNPSRPQSQSPIATEPEPRKAA